MILYGVTKSSKLLDQVISNFLFQILLDLIFQYKCRKNADQNQKNSEYRHFSRSGFQCIKYDSCNINSSFPDIFNNFSYELVQSLFKNWSTRLCKFSTLNRELADDID